MQTRTHGKDAGMMLVMGPVAASIYTRRRHDGKIVQCKDLPGDVSANERLSRRAAANERYMHQSCEGVG